MPSIKTVLTQHDPKLELLLSAARTLLSAGISFRSATRGEYAGLAPGTMQLNVWQRIAFGAHANAEREKLGKKVILLNSSDPLPTLSDIPVAYHALRTLLGAPTTVLALYTAVTGKSPRKGLPLSTFGRIHKVSVVLAAGYTTVHSALEVYRRRRELLQQAGYAAGLTAGFIESKLPFRKKRLSSDPSSLADLTPETVAQLLSLVDAKDTEALIRRIDDKILRGEIDIKQFFQGTGLPEGAVLPPVDDTNG